MGLIKDAFWASRFDSHALGAKLIGGSDIAALLAGDISNPETDADNTTVTDDTQTGE